MKKIFSFMIMSALCLSLAVPAFASDTTTVTSESNPVVAHWEDGNTETFRLADGTEITFYVKDMGPTTLAALKSGSSFTAFADRPTPHDYNCIPSDGDYANVTVGNIDENDEARMRVSITVTVNGATITRDKNLYPGEEHGVNAIDNAGNGLDCTFHTMITPLNYTPIEYSYDAIQDWRH